MCEEGGYGALSACNSSPGLQISEAHVNEGEVEGCALLYHLVEELHCHRDQMDHGVLSAA